METIILPFGAPAWERRKRILKDIIKSRPGPPYDYRDVLYLVPNERTVKTLKILFIEALEDETGARGCIPPRINTLNGFIGRKSKSASKRPVVEDMAKSLVLEEICRRTAVDVNVPGVPAEVLGPSLAPELSDALDNLYRYRVGETAVARLSGDSLPLTLLLRVKKEYERWLDRNGLAGLYYPDAYIPANGEFKSFRGVVLDGFYDADPTELSVLKELSNAPDCKFILEAPGLSRDSAAHEGMPYSGADRLLEALGAGGALDGAPLDAAASEADALSGAVFEGRPLHEAWARIKDTDSWPRDINVVGALNPAEEVYFIAGGIKQSCREGSLDLNRVLVFFPDLDAYLPLLEEAFGDLGVPYHVSQGYPLMQSPVVTAFLNLLSLPLDNYSYKGIRKVFSSPFVALAEGGNRPEAFDAFARRAGITGGRRRWLGGLAHAPDEDEAGTIRTRLEKLFFLMGPFETKSQPVSRWIKAALRLLDDCGLTAQVEGLRGPGPELSYALEELAGTLEEIDGASSRLKGPMDLPEFLYMVRKSLSGRRFRTEEGGPAGVRVLGRLETLSEPFDVIYAGGLIENALPGAKRPGIFFPSGTAAKLGLPGTAEARGRDARLFLGLILGAPRVFLCHPESRDGSPASPSPYIRALEPFFRAGAIKRVSHASRPMEPEKAQGPAGFLRSLAFGASLAGIKGPAVAGALKRLSEGAPGLERARAVLLPSPPVEPPRPPEKKEFWVTELEEYNLCHYRYYQSRVAMSAPPDEPEDDVAPDRAGSIIHRILKEFYADKKPVTAPDREKALKRLVALAGKKFKDLPDTTVNRELARRFTEFLAPRFIEEEAALAETGFTVCGTEVPVEIEVEDPEAGHVVITGKIDRVELDRAGDFTVVDYKTGNYPGSGRPLSDMFQLPLYAHMLREKPGLIKGGQTPARPAGFVYYNLKQGTMRDVVYYSGEEAPKTLLKKRPRRKLSAEEMEGLINGAYNAAVEAIRGILAGRFAPTCTVDFICQRCVYAAVCVKGRKAEDKDAEEAVKGSDDGEG